MGHILFSNASSMMAIAHDKKLSQMHNVFEDPFVEKGMRTRFSGSAHNFSRLFAFFIDTVIDKNYQELLKSGETHPLYFFSMLAPAITRAWHGVFEFQEYMKDKWEKVQPVLDVLPKDIAERTLNAGSTADNVAIARDILMALEKGKESLAEAARKAAEEGEEEGDGSESASDDGLEDEEGDAEDADTKGKPSKSKPKDKKARDEDVGPEPLDGDPGDTEGGAPSDDGGDGAGAASDDKKDESEKDGEEKDTDKEPAKRPRESDEAAEDEDKSDDADETGDGAGDEIDDDDDSGDEPVADDCELPEIEISDLESGMEGEISRLVAEDTRKGDYSVYSTDFDEVKPLDLKKFEGPHLDRAVERMVDKVSDMAAQIQSDLQRSFVAENRSYWQNAQQTGRINPSSLARLYTGDTRVFRRKVEHRTQDYDVSILIDCSGSMRHGDGDMTRIDAAMLSAYAIGAALDSIGVNFELLGFSSKEDKLEGSEIRDAEAKGGFTYSRCAALYMPIFKSFEDHWGPDSWRRLAAYMTDPSELRENADGECVMIAAKRLFTQPSKGKALLVLSDGSPSCYSPKGYDSKAQSDHLKRVVREVTDAGVKVFGIGIQTESVKRYYPECAVLNDIKKLPSEVIGRISEMLLG